MKNPAIKLLLVLLVLITASLACNLPQSQEVTPPTSEPVNPAELDQLENQLRETIEVPESGEVSIDVTQEQLTAFLASELANQNEPILTDPVVVLTNGQVEIYGTLSQSGLQVNTRIVLQPRINAEGNPNFDIVSIDLGPLPVPESLRNRFETIVDNTLNRYLIAYADEFQVTDITVHEGYMTITGVRP